MGAFAVQAMLPPVMAGSTSCSKYRSAASAAPTALLRPPPAQASRPLRQDSAERLERAGPGTVGRRRVTDHEAVASRHSPPGVRQIEAKLLQSLDPQALGGRGL